MSEAKATVLLQHYVIVTPNLPFAEWTEILRGSRAIRQ